MHFTQRDHSTALKWSALDSYMNNIFASTRWKRKRSNVRKKKFRKKFTCFSFSFAFLDHNIWLRVYAIFSSVSRPCEECYWFKWKKFTALQFFSSFCFVLILSEFLRSVESLTPFRTFISVYQFRINEMRKSKRSFARCCCCCCLFLLLLGNVPNGKKWTKMLTNASKEKQTLLLTILHSSNECAHFTTGETIQNVQQKKMSVKRKKPISPHIQWKLI